MKIKRIVCIVSLFVIILSVSIIYFLKNLSVQMAEKEMLITEKVSLEEEFEQKQTELLVLNADIAKQQEVVAECEERLAILRAKSQEIQAVMDRENALYNISLEGMPINYDVENFREAEKTSGQVSMGVGLFFGEQIGQMLDNDENSNVSSAEKLRLALYKELSHFLKDSYYELASAKVSFDACYSFYNELIQTESDELLLANEVLLENVDIEQLCVEERENLLNALAKYCYDLSYVYMLYDNTLTDNEWIYLAGLKQQVDDMKQLIPSYDSEETKYGYTEEEELSRCKRIIYKYVSVINELAARNTDGGIKWGSTITDYGSSVNKGYFNKEKVIIMEQEMVWGNTIRKYYYDREGNPLYIDYDTFDILVKDGVGIEVHPDANNPHDKEWIQQWVTEAVEVKDKYLEAYYGDGRY